MLSSQVTQKLGLGGARQLRLLGARHAVTVPHGRSRQTRHSTGAPGSQTGWEESNPTPRVCQKGSYPGNDTRDEHGRLGRAAKTKREKATSGNSSTRRQAEGAWGRQVWGGHNRDGGKGANLLF